MSRYDPDIETVQDMLCREPHHGRTDFSHQCFLGKNHDDEFHQTILGQRWPVTT